MNLFCSHFLDKYFKHPKLVGMTYFEHLFFSLNLCYLFLCGFLQAVIHSFYPDLFVTSSCFYSKQIYDIINARNKICKID